MKLFGGKIAQSIYCSIVFGMLLFFGSKTALASDDHLVINEVYYDTVGTDSDEEWIELYNPTAVDIPISDYQITYSTHKIIILADQTIKSQEFVVIARNQSDFKLVYGLDSLNVTGFNFDLPNSGGYLVLQNEKAEEIDAVFWEKVGPKGENFAANVATGHSIEREPLGLDRDDCSKDFVDREPPTPGVEYSNIIDRVEDETINIQEARGLENGEDVTITGAVTSLPGVLSSQYFYIQDTTGGIQIYCYYKIFPSFVLGDIISVSGELSETNNERRIKIKSSDDIIILNHIEPVIPAEIAISEINEKNEGTYIKTMGIVTQTSGDTFFISDGQTEIKVVIKSSTGIDKPKMKKGDQVEVTGIISQYKEEYRILPIDQNDVKIIASEGQLPRAGSTELFYFIISLFLSILWYIYLEAKKKPTP